MQNIDYVFKIILIGNQGVGKSSLMARFVDQIYTESYLSTIGVDFKIKTLTLDQTKVKLQIWDTAGQERFSALTHSHFRGSHGCICVFDCTDPKQALFQFNFAIRTLDIAQKYLQITIDEYGLIPEACYLVANKIDLINRKVTEKDGLLIAEQLGCKYMECSAKDDINVQDLFKELTVQIMGLVEQNRAPAIIPGMQIQQQVESEQIKKKSKCC